MAIPAEGPLSLVIEVQYLKANIYKLMRGQSSNVYCIKKII